MRTVLLTILLAAVATPASHAQTAEGRKFGKGFVPEKPEVYAARPATVVTRAPLPSEIDLAGFFPPPGNQGQQSSCVAWSTAYARSYYEVVLNQADSRRAANIVSPAYIYNATHPNAKDCDEGTAYSSAFQVLESGAVSMQDFPYNEKRCSEVPPDPAKMDGSRFRIDRRTQVIRGGSVAERENAIKQTLANGQPVIFGMDVDDRFQEFRKFNLPKLADRCERNFEYREKPADGGGHAMVIVGYSNSRQAFKVLNSWGTDWGCNGYAWISFATILSQAPEFYILNPTNASRERLKEVARSVSRWGDPQTEESIRKTVSTQGEGTSPAAGARIEAAQKQLDTLLQNVSRNAGCALLAGKVDAQTNARVGGILPSSLALHQLKQALAAMQSIQRVDISFTKVRPWPQCEAMIAMLPVLDAPGGIGLTTGGQREAHLKAGEVLRLEAVSPDKQAYVYLVYLQVGGEAVPVFKSDKLVAPRSKISYPPPGSTSVPRVAAPFGDEMAIALATSDRLPELESIGQTTDREFLTVLEQATRNAQRRGKFFISAAMVPITTAER